jgi:hypothetical protein
MSDGSKQVQLNFDIDLVRGEEVRERGESNWWPLTLVVLKCWDVCVVGSIYEDIVKGIASLDYPDVLFLDIEWDVRYSCPAQNSAYG